MGKPSVRVVIPCFNHGSYVREAALSAFALEDAGVEVVVVDDGSDDGTSPARCDECKAFGATVIHQANGGLSAARNRGAAGARTEYLAFLDADDLLLPNFARDLAAAIEAEIEAGRSDVSHAYGQEQVTGIYELVWKVPPWDPVRELITNLHPVTALVRRDVFERAGGFDEAMRQGHEDWEFWIRCVELRLRGVRVEKPVFVWRRFHTKSLLYEALDCYEGNVAHILARHADLYREHALPIIERALEMLHHSDATWLDEDYGPIHVRTRRAWVAQLEAERAGLVAQRDTAERETAAAREQSDAAEREATAVAAQRDAALRDAAALAEEIVRVRESYEAKPSVRFSRAMHAVLESLPQPLSKLLRGMLRTIERVIAP